MEDNKYYTPEIEEFHVGFEYEARPKGSEVDFIKFRIEKNEIYYSLYSLFKTSEIRVKYLDNEDIESLGWKEDIESLGWKVEQKPLGSWNEGEYYVENKEGCTVFDFDNIDPSEPTIIFNGVTFIIKNKSELKKLIQQLNIQ
jgi:hypothetical protein